MTIEDLENNMKNCISCKDCLSEYDVIPNPIFYGNTKSKIMLIGQAPGITEYEVGKTFQGDTGKSIKKLFQECGLTEFDNNVYQTSVTKCFPGRKVHLSTDRKPSKQEIENCTPFLKKQIDLLKPKIIVCLGMLSWKTLISFTDEESEKSIHDLYGKSMSKLTTGDIVGKSFLYKNALVIPMIHPSGAANGSRSKNKIQHEKSINILAQTIKTL